MNKEQIKWFAIKVFNAVYTHIHTLQANTDDVNAICNTGWEFLALYISTEKDFTLQQIAEMAGDFDSKVRNFVLSEEEISHFADLFAQKAEKEINNETNH